MGKIDSGFTNADSDNLPKIDMAMVNDFYVDNMQFFNTKMRNVKAKKLLGGVDKRLCAGGGCARVDPDSPKTMSGFPAAVVNVDKKINFLRHYAGDIRADSAAPESLYRRFSGRVITCNLLFLVFTMFIKFSDL